MIKRLKVILALALALFMMVTISVAPALANDDRDDNLLRRDIRLDRQILHELRTDDVNCCRQFDVNPGFIVSSPFVFGCWEWSSVFERWEWECD